MIEGKINPEQPVLGSIVKVDQGGGLVAEVSLIGVNKVFHGIRDYNHQFSSGVMAARWILESCSSEEGLDSLVSAENDSRGWLRMSLLLDNADVLDKIGLSLDSVSGKKSTVMFNGQSIGEGEMRLNLVAGDKLNSFLSALSVEQVNHFNLRDDLVDMSVIFTDQLLDNYDLSKPTETALELLVNLDKVVLQYKRLGLNQVISKLEIYSNHIKTRDLREFLIVDKEKLLIEPGKGFGPGDWQKDANPEFLWKKWSGALDILRMLKESSNGVGMYTGLSEHLKKCLSSAMENMLTLDYYPEGRKLELIEVLEKVNARFELEDEKN